MLRLRNDDVPALPVVTLCDVPVTNATRLEAVALLERWMEAGDGRARAAYIVNAHTLNLAWNAPAYRALLARGDVVFADGTGMRLAARLKGVRLRDNLVGTDLVPALFTGASGRHARCFLLGGQPGTPERAARHLRARFPDLRIAGLHHGHFGSRDTPAVLRLIRAAAPDVLLVAMGNPLQERWIDRHRAELRVPVSLGVGGLFDHWAGTLRRAPRWVRRLGLEWCQILFQQPHKWRRYLLGNPTFVYRALRDARRDAS